PINAWSIWRDENVEISGGPVITSRENDASERISCARCGGCIANHKPQISMTVVYPMTLDGSAFEYEPSSHIFYSERVMDFADGLPKYADMPERMGGTGEQIEEPTKTSWRS
ncbi:MAG: GFA family protein, partial [Roseibium sp.]|uniref:GFA family protein n=1 Tax=Roseibium sp. TaxID=1936156 RepID=UPI002636EEF4